MHLRCWFARKMSQFTRFCGVKFLAWKSGCVRFLTNSMSYHHFDKKIKYGLQNRRKRDLQPKSNEAFVRMLQKASTWVHQGFTPFSFTNSVQMILCSLRRILWFIWGHFSWKDSVQMVPSSLRRIITISLTGHIYWEVYFKDLTIM